MTVVHEVRLSKISDIMLRVSDLARSLAFYRDTLGMSVQSSIPNWAFLDGGGVTLALRSGGGQLGDTGVASHEVVFLVDDIHAAFNSLRSKGIAFSVEPRSVTATDSREFWAADFRDPDGHALSITAWLPKR